MNGRPKFHGWVIDTDHLAVADGPGGARQRRTESRVGYGQELSPYRPVSAALDAGLVVDPVPFDLYDDDGQRYYSGVISQRWVKASSDHAFAPLDFARRDAGATEMRLNGRPV